MVAFAFAGSPVYFLFSCSPSAYCGTWWSPQILAKTASRLIWIFRSAYLSEFPWVLPSAKPLRSLQIAYKGVRQRSSKNLFLVTQSGSWCIRIKLICQVRTNTSYTKSLRPPIMISVIYFYPIYSPLSPEIASCQLFTTATHFEMLCLYLMFPWCLDLAQRLRGPNTLTNILMDESAVRPVDQCGKTSISNVFESLMAVW